MVDLVRTARGADGRAADDGTAAEAGRAVAALKPPRPSRSTGWALRWDAATMSNAPPHRPGRGRWWAGDISDGVNEWNPETMVLFRDDYRQLPARAHVLLPGDGEKREWSFGPFQCD